MHILVLCHSFPYPENDTYKYMIMQNVRALYRKGVKITLLCQADSQEINHIENIPDEIQKLANYHVVEVEKKIVFLDKLTNFLFSDKSIEVNNYYTLGFVEELKKIIAQTPPDIVQFEGIDMAVYRKEVAIEKCVLRIHTYDSAKYNALLASTKDIVRKAYYQASKERLEKWEWEQIISDKFRCLLLYDNTFKNAIKAQINQEKPIAISTYTPLYGIDFSNISHSEEIKAEAHSVYWYGSLDIANNQASLSWFITKIWAKVFANYPHAKFYIAARHRSPNFLPNISTTQGIYWEDNISNIYDFMASKAIMVLPMLSYSGQQVRLLEAMAIGNAIVASKAATQAIPAKHGEHLFVAEDEHKFIQLLSTLIESPNIGIAMGNHAKSVRERFTQEIMDERLFNFYQGL